MNHFSKLIVLSFLMGGVLFALPGCEFGAKTIPVEETTSDIDIDDDETETEDNDIDTDDDETESGDDDIDTDDDETESDVDTDDDETEIRGEPQYIPFTQELYDSMLGENAFALFFHASWCPTCIWMDSEINENLANYPASAIILQIDYDNSDELQAEYGIKTQSTIVFLDAQGNVTDTLVAPDSDQIVAAIENSLE